MYKGKRIVGVIPARGGSKGLPKKNIRPLCGKPLIVWTLEEAQASRLLDRVIVSTDSVEIAEVARKAGGDVPFMRPTKLAQDTSTSLDVQAHAIAWLKEHGETYDYLAQLEPTSPLREPSDIDACIQQLIDHPRAKSIVSVAKLEGGHPEFNVLIDKKTGCIRRPDGTANFKFLRRQELSDIYFFEGTMYLSEIKTLLERHTFYHELTLPYVVPRWKSPEIDELEDFIAIEALLKAKRGGNG